MAEEVESAELELERKWKEEREAPPTDPRAAVGPVAVPSTSAAAPATPGPAAPATPVPTCLSHQEALEAKEADGETADVVESGATGRLTKARETAVGPANNARVDAK
ncbi:hypothetical protein QFC20_004928 [Naganishia adeliensis]|uniref:Uncharacterized protein n=1 Tax=Naganishia adeliensis TaxID=92952 RepID=A0ACC2VW27_9TREE|nr:hypothetical protein QFC20_004928 [Naganishia adeliensis]